MDRYEALRLIALGGAYKPDSESNVRYVMRWYSKTFHTPLHEVYELPLDDVWLAFYEERYQALEREDLEAEVAKTLESPEARAEREMADEAEKASSMEFAKMSEGMANVTKMANKIKDSIDSVDRAPSSIPETAPPVIEENIQMEFVDDAEMEKLMNDGMATQTKVNPMSFK